jgi:hypothetical protein
MSVALAEAGSRKSQLPSPVIYMGSQAELPVFRPTRIDRLATEIEMLDVATSSLL